MLNAAYAVGLGSCWINRCKQMFEFPEGKALLRKWGLSENLRGVLDVVSCSIRGHFAEAWNLSGKGVDVGHPEIHSGQCAPA